MDRTPSRLPAPGPASSEEADTLSSLFAAAPHRATVVFKRRRSVGTPDGGANEPSIEVDDPARAAAPRAPKVFRTPNAVPAPSAQADRLPGGAGGQADAAPQKVSRRRRSDLRAPRLISHIVVAPSAPDREETGSLPRHRILADLTLVSEQAALYASVCGALDDVRSTLGAARLAEAFELP